MASKTKERIIEKSEGKIRQKADQEKKVMAAVEHELAEVRETVSSIAAITAKIDSLEAKKRGTTAAIAEIEATVARDYKPAVKMGTSGETFYYVKMEEEDARYQGLITDRKKLLTDRMAVDSDLARLYGENHALAERATTLQMDIERKWRVIMNLQKAMARAQKVEE